MVLQKGKIGGGMRRLSWDEEAQGSFHNRGKNAWALKSHKRDSFPICPLFPPPMLGFMFQKMLKFQIPEPMNVSLFRNTIFADDQM